MFHLIYVSTKHFLLYRQPRTLSPAALEHASQELGQMSELAEMRTAVTNIFLSLGGLRVVDSAAGIVPRYVYLTPWQRQLIAMVTPYGFKVGLL